MIETIGHRGTAGLEPENTVRAIKRAIELGVDRVEIDVRVTSDGRLVVIHDETVDRTTDGHGYVRDLTFEVLRRLDAGKGERIPTLEEALWIAQNKVVLQIELKVEEATEPVVRLVEKLSAGNDVIITSFSHELLKKVHELNPSLRTGALFFEAPADIFQRALDSCSEAIHVNHGKITCELVEEAHRRGLKIVAWNLDEEEGIKKMIELGVDAIGSNRPDILVNTLRRRTDYR